MASRYYAAFFVSAFIGLRSTKWPNYDLHNCGFSLRTPNTSPPRTGGSRDTAESYIRTHPREIFTYRPLHNGENMDADRQIRLIELLPAKPGQSGDLVECRLKAVSINKEKRYNELRYDALSYCWGDSREVAEIICNGKSLTIRKNLEQALRYLRDRNQPGSPDLVWADAICINQDDKREKFAQVGLMGTIFSQSQQTLIWLGQPNDLDSRRPSAVVGLGIRIGLRALTAVFNTKDCPQISVSDRKARTNFELSPFSGPLYLDLISILQRPWFTRAWVVQEAALSPKATLIWDGKEYDWDRLVAALKFMPKVQFPLAFLPSLQHIAAINNERDRQRSGPSTLLGALLRHQRTIASFDEDKVFAFIGLVNDGESQSSAVQADFIENSIPEAMYLEMARKIIERHKSLDLLSHPPYKDRHERRDLPSWVPDWSISTSVDMGSTWSYGPLSLAGAELRRNQAEASRFSAAGKTRHLSEEHESPGNLTVRGHHLDAIVDVGPAFDGISLPSGVRTFMDLYNGWMGTLRTFHYARQVMTSWQGMAVEGCRGTYKPTGEPLEEAFWQTVCAGEYRTVEKVHESAKLWHRAIRSSGLASFQSFASSDILKRAYGMYILARNLLSNKPLLEFELQGRYTLNRRLVRTSRGFIGLASRWVENGDAVVLCKGSGVPLLLRKQDGSEGWRCVGDAYIHGVMYGEAFHEEECDRLVLK